MEPDVMTIVEAADYLRISQKTVYRLAVSRKLPAKKVGRQWRFHRSVLDNYLGVPPERKSA